ncbi:hypothetical protein [Ruminococcus sp. FC2018]|uniref:hypothetical protein n=1 Tax=Ruminococcus sp. FC2018 TaxID=1410617 RepID=UPI00048A4744|nr:hypothetical protein [Ruminococcus sp. FC2018]
MNNKILDIIGLADEKYLHEAQGEGQIKQTKHRRKISAKFVAVAAAAAVMTVTAGAVAVAKLSNKEGVREFYDSSAVSKMESRGMLSGKTSENEHFRFNMQSVIKDDYVCSCIFAVEPLDEKAQDYLEKVMGFDADAFYADNNEALYMSALTSWGWKEYKKGDKSLNFELDITAHYGKRNVDFSRPIRLEFKQAENDLNNKPYKDEKLLDGIVLDIPQAQKLKDVKLYSDDGKELYLSETGFVALVSMPIAKSEAEHKMLVEKGEYDLDFKIKFKDGTVKTNWDENMEAGGLGLMLDDTDVGFRQAFRTMVDVDKVESVTFKNREFKRK